MSRRPIRSDTQKARRSPGFSASPEDDEASSPEKSEPRTPNRSEPRTPNKLNSHSTPGKQGHCKESNDDEEISDDCEDNEVHRANADNLDDIRNQKVLDVPSVNPLSSIYWPYALAILSCGIVAIGGYKLFSPSAGLTGKSYNNQVSYNLGESVAEGLQKKFKNQAKFSFKIVKKSVDRVAKSDGEPESPSSVILVSSKGAEDTVNCFANQFAKLVHHDENFVKIDGKKLQKKDSDTVKENIDDAILEYDSDDKVRVVLIQNIDYLPGHSPLIFYRYCDDQNAPFKKAVVIMTVFGKKPISKEFQFKELNAIARDRLNETWSAIPPDQFDPLFNRIATYVIGINKETDLSHC